MKVLNIRLEIILCILTKLWLSVEVEAQDVQTCKRFADSSYLAGNYGVALKEYQRVYFFSEHKDDPELFERAGDCHLYLNQPASALEFYDRAYFIYQRSDEKNNVFFKRIHVMIKSGSYKLALIDLLGHEVNDSSEFARQKAFYIGVCYFGLENFSKSEEYFIASLSGNYPEAAQKIKDIFSTRKYFEQPNPTAATIMSLILPGSGQMYSGEIVSGINSLVLCGGLITLWGITAYQYSLIDALVSVTPWLQRYYQGGMHNARNFAIQKRAKNRSEAYRQILEVLKRSNKTEQP